MSHVSINLAALNFIKSWLLPNELYTYALMNHVSIDMSFKTLIKSAFFLKELCKSAQMNHVSIGMNLIDFDRLYIIDVFPTKLDTCSKMDHVSIKVIGLNFIKCSSPPEE